MGAVTEPPTQFRCDLCGCRFTHGEQVCGRCPMSAGCELIACPNCGYSVPRHSSLLGLLRRILRRTP